jgi:hypothetical protein
VRGYLATGIPDSSFRGRMVRTGLRLTEQASLTVFEVPDIDLHRAYSPTRLPTAIAKGGSGRRIDIPGPVLREVWDYIRFERAEVIEDARARGAYDQLDDLLGRNTSAAARIRRWRACLRLRRLLPLPVRRSGRHLGVQLCRRGPRIHPPTNSSTPTPATTTRAAGRPTNQAWQANPCLPMAGSDTSEADH